MKPLRLHALYSCLNGHDVFNEEARVTSFRLLSICVNDREMYGLRESLRMLFWYAICSMVLCSYGVTRPYRQIGNVRVYQPSMDHPWGSWPEAIRVVNTYGNAEDALDNAETRPPGTKQRTAPSNRKRTFSWRGDDLLINFQIAPPTTYDCTKLTPPLTWLGTDNTGGSRVKVLHQSDGERKNVDINANTYIQGRNSVQITVSRRRVEDALALLRMNGFQKEDIYRMLDKGPWLMSFDLGKVISRLKKDLVDDNPNYSFTQAQALHIISHCPYLLAQYSRYRGRDVRATIEALMEVGYSSETLVRNIMRFPTMLSAPPDRIRGWQTLLNSFGVAEKPHLFGKLLSKAPFMFYVDPPTIFDYLGPECGDSSCNDPATAASSGFFLYGAMAVLQHLQQLRLKDMDRIVRSEPYLLVQDPNEVAARIDFLSGLFLEHLEIRKGVQAKGEIGEIQSPSLNKNYRSETSQNPSDGNDFATSSLGAAHGLSILKDKDGAYPYRNELLCLLNSFISAYPAVLSVPVSQSRSVCNALRACGIRRADVIALVRKHPPVLNIEDCQIRELVTFLRDRVGLHKLNVVSFLLRNPEVLKQDIDALHAKMAYWLEIGGNFQVRKYPRFLMMDLENDFIPRVKFLKAMQIDPQSIGGLNFLVSASPEQLSTKAGVSLDIYHTFADIYRDHMRANYDIGHDSRNENENEDGDSMNKN
jgi:hypothetical protein